MSSAGYLPGTLALIDSLRVTGFDGEVTVLDTGLDGHERAVLERRATVRTLPGDPSIHAVLRKPRLHELEPAGVVIFIDSDMIITRSLAHVVEQAEAGKICLFADHHSSGERAFPVWETTFELSAPLRRRRHLNTGFAAFSVDHWPDLLRRWDDACRRIPPDAVFVPVMHEPAATRFASRPFWGGDQDALNAILMSEIPEAAIAQQPEDEEIYPETLPEVEIVDEVSLECRYRGGSPVVLHYLLSPKPWQSELVAARARRRVRAAAAAPARRRPRGSRRPAALAAAGRRRRGGAPGARSPERRQGCRREGGASRRTGASELPFGRHCSRCATGSRRGADTTPRVSESRPRVDVGMPTRGEAPYIGEAISSVCAQSYADWTLRISENGPGGGELEDRLAPYLGDERIRYSATGHDLGAAQNHTRLLRAGDAPYVGHPPRRRPLGPGVPRTTRRLPRAPPRVWLRLLRQPRDRRDLAGDRKLGARAQRRRSRAA